MNKLIALLALSMLFSCGNKEEDPQPAAAAPIVEEPRPIICDKITWDTTIIFSGGQVVDKFRLKESCDSLTVDFLLYPETIKIKLPTKETPQLTVISEGTYTFQVMGRTGRNRIYATIHGNGKIGYMLGHNSIYVASKLDHSKY